MTPEELARLCDRMAERASRRAAQAAAESVPIEDDPHVRRMMHRLGLLASAHGGERTARAARAVIEAMRTPRADAHEVARRFRAYAAPSDPDAPCADEPRCAECDLNDACRHYNRPPTIKQLPEDARPRERLLRKGGASLSEAELLAILIGSGRGGETAVHLAQRLLRAYGDLKGVGRRSPAEFLRVPGIGPAKAAQIGAAIELARRMASTAFEPGAAFRGSGQVYEHLRHRLADERVETFIALLLDTKNRLMSERIVSRGGLDASPVHPRDVFTDAVREAASAVIFVHNHPSGDPTPSPEDLSLTKRLKEAGALLGIRVLDHLIIGRDAYRSLADEGLL